MEENKISIRTDLALEAKEIYYPDSDNPDGVEMIVEEETEYGIQVTIVKIKSKEGSERMQKPIGTYITVESDTMKENNTDAHEEIIKVVSQKLGELHSLDKDSTVLIVGLGNWNITPDALGPKVISKVLITRHIQDSIPEELKGKVRRTSGMSPGVMGLTGIETGEIVKGIVDKVKPDIVIAVDALAARRANRINATIQMSDTGINPGAGVGNKRMTLCKESLGVPVIAIGVPTVVDAATLVNDTMDIMLSSMIEESEKGTDFYRMLKELEGEEKYAIIRQVLDPYSGNMFVTPKEVDAVIERLSAIIANALNIGLHPGISKEDINRYI